MTESGGGKQASEKRDDMRRPQSGLRLGFGGLAVGAAPVQYCSNVCSPIVEQLVGSSRIPF